VRVIVPTKRPAIILSGHDMNDEIDDTAWFGGPGYEWLRPGMPRCLGA
jgi:hypothetical protein